jgi:hypothetical protein
VVQTGLLKGEFKNQKAKVKTTNQKLKKCKNKPKVRQLKSELLPASSEHVQHLCWTQDE